MDLDREHELAEDSAARGNAVAPINATLAVGDELERAQAKSWMEPW